MKMQYKTAEFSIGEICQYHYGCTTYLAQILTVTEFPVYTSYRAKVKNIYNEYVEVVADQEYFTKYEPTEEEFTEWILDRMKGVKCR